MTAKQNSLSGGALAFVIVTAVIILIVVLYMLLGKKKDPYTRMRDIGRFNLTEPDRDAGTCTSCGR